MKKSYIAAALALTSCLVLGTAAAKPVQDCDRHLPPRHDPEGQRYTYTVRDTTGVRVSPWSTTEPPTCLWPP